MIEIIATVMLFGGIGFLVLLLIANLIWIIWYKRNYTFRKEHGHLWHKCYKCKKTEGTMYWSNIFWGRVYHCDKHAFERREEDVL